MSVQEVTITYVSALQSIETLYGSAKYQVLFDASLVELGNIIMFEYKIQDVDTSANMSNTSFGFVSIENAIQSGIANQYIISVPAENFTNDLDVTNTIQVRVYTGTSDNTNNVNITNWSNELNIYNPPGVPVINSALYDPSDNNISDLYVYMDVSVNPAYNYDSVNFIVCYYYQDPSGNTIWGTSEPLVSSSTTTGRQLLVSQFGTVGTDNSVYLSIHAVYSWNTDVSNNYYAISYMSNEVSASPGSLDNYPIITSLIYNVYQEPPMDPPTPEIPGTQTMTITWMPPGNYTIPTFNVKKYSILASVNNGPFNIVEDVSSNILTSNVNVGVGGLNMNGNDDVRFQVLATTVNELLEYSPDSQTMYYFQYAEAPSELTVTSSSYNDNVGSANISIFFQGISDSQKGPGTGNYYVVEINGQQFTPGYAITYESDASYNIEFYNLEVPTSEDISVYLVITDTNSENLLNGASTTTPYIAVNLVQVPVNYDIYVIPHDTQRMTLQWYPLSAPNWSVNHYEIFVNGVFDGSNNNTDNDYEFEPPQLDFTTLNTYNFVIRAIMDATNSDVQYTVYSNEVSENTFTYASAPTNLVISNVNTDVDMTVSFQGVDDSNIGGKGLGLGLQYVVEINGTPQTPSSGSLDFSANAYYEIVFSDISVNAVGIVSVYLQTQDTNPPNSELDGAAIEAPYIATSITLNPVDYSVYTDNSQVMNLSWNAPAYLGDWSVAHYDVYVNIDGGGMYLDASTNSTNYPYVPVNTGNYNFEIHAILVNGETTYEVVSNTESQNYFSFPSEPIVTVNWATNNNDGSSMDLNMSFNYPDPDGVTDGINSFYVQVFDLSNNAITTQTVNYHNSPIYTITFDNILYSSQGTVAVTPQVMDNNSPFLLLNSLNVGTSGYTVSPIPVFDDVIIDTNNSASGSIASNTTLGPNGIVIYPTGNTSAQLASVQTTAQTAGWTITLTGSSADTFIYSFSLDAPLFFGALGVSTPPGYAIVISNSSGAVSTQIAPPQSV